MDACRERQGAYDQLMGAVDGERCESFDAHVFAASLSMAAAEAIIDGRSLTAGTGLDAHALVDLVGEYFPGAESVVGSCDETEEPVVTPEEWSLRELLTQNTTDGSQLEEWLAVVVTRRAQRPNHLWQDLGLRNRAELSRLMKRHFAPLADSNTRDMKWKKFLYRIICRNEGLAMCTAPCCSECPDLDTCFGDENGKSLLASHRWNAEPGAE
jgi:nitrogen fixation protein NifQ